MSVAWTGYKLPLQVAVGVGLSLSVLMGLEIADVTGSRSNDQGQCFGPRIESPVYFKNLR